MAGVEDHLSTTLVPGLVQQPQNKGSITQGEVAPKPPFTELLLVLFGPRSLVLKRCAVHMMERQGVTYDCTTP